VVEVTEGAFLGRGADRVAEELEALHALGVVVALDDFGTGHASLTHLKRFPVGMLKVDASFVRDMLDDPGDAAIMRAVAGLGRSLGMRVVAEGVETAEQAAELTRLGASFLQGFSLARPMTGGHTAAWFAARGKTETTS
jgi:EAL domain-containing protein (putative c-di-GMP-specific phosphodiesterase class I)